MIYINRILSPMYLPKRQFLYTSLVYITTWTTDVKIINLWDIFQLVGLNFNSELKKVFLSSEHKGISKRIIHQGQALRVYSKNLLFFERVFFGKTLLLLFSF